MVLFHNTRSLFSNLKSTDPLDLNSCLIYKIDCLDYKDGLYYMGETKQYLKNRKYQHIYNIKRNNHNQFQLCQQNLENSHNFDFHNTQILHKFKNRHKKAKIEFLYIQSSNSVNNKTDMLYNLPNYKYVIE